MPHRLRKVRKQRGFRTHGFGKVGQHRKKGSHGMRKGGRHKHLWSYVIRYEPDYFGKCGFTSPKSLKQKVNIINVGELDELAKKSSTREEEEGKLFVDLENLGYTKLLGSGKVTNPLVIKVGAFSKSAEEKIKKVGGQILGEVEQEGE